MPDSPASDWKCLDCGHLWHGYSHEHDCRPHRPTKIEEIKRGYQPTPVSENSSPATPYKPGLSLIVKYFGFYKHGEIGQPMRELAQRMDELLYESPEKSAGLRKLLEARDCFVRARSEGKRG